MTRFALQLTRSSLQLLNKLNVHFISSNFRDIDGEENSLVASSSINDAEEDEEPALVVENSPTSSTSDGGGDGGSAPEEKLETKPDIDDQENDDEEGDYDYEEENKENKDAEEGAPAAVAEEDGEVQEDGNDNDNDQPTTSTLSPPAGTTGPSSPSPSLDPIIVDTSRRFPPDMPFIQAIATCNSFECVRDAHRQPRKGARFNFPHFLIVGWQKSATTSLYV